MTDSGFNLLKCEAEELVQHLLQNRFASDEMATAEFLRSAVSSLPNAESISDKLVVQQQGEKRATAEEVKTDGTTDSSSSSNASNASIGDSILPDDKPSVALTCVQPRAKMDVVFGTEGIQFTDKKGDSFSVRSVDHIIVFPKSEDCRAKKKKVANMVLLVWNDTEDEGTAAVSYKKKSLHQVCIQLPFESPYPAVTETTASSSDVDSDNEEDKKKADDDATSEWMNLLATSLSFPIENMAIARNPTAPVVPKGDSNGSNNQNYRFASHQDASMSTTVSGMPFLPCYHGVNDGVLFPLQEGLLFCKPPLFLPRSTLRSIECRGSNRYVTLFVVLDDKEQLEFTNIHTQEQDVLHKYIHETLIPAMQRDVAAEDGDDGVEEIANDGEEEDQNSNKKSHKRKAVTEAANVNKKRVQQQESGEDDDEEEDDEDYDLGEAQREDDENESGSDDDDDDDDEEDFEEQATETESEDED